MAYGLSLHYFTPLGVPSTYERDEQLIAHLTFLFQQEGQLQWYLLATNALFPTVGVRSLHQLSSGSSATHGGWQHLD